MSLGLDKTQKKAVSTGPIICAVAFSAQKLHVYEGARRLVTLLGLYTNQKASSLQRKSYGTHLYGSLWLLPPSQCCSLKGRFKLELHRNAECTKK